MTAIIAWTCKRCGHHVEGLSVAEYMAADAAHTCRPADMIRRAAAYCDARGPVLRAVAEWLTDCAEAAKHMEHEADWDVCAAPHSVRDALRIASAVPSEEPR